MDAREERQLLRLKAQLAKLEPPFDEFLTSYKAKYAKACECLKKDRDELLTFYDFPA